MTTWSTSWLFSGALKAAATVRHERSTWNRSAFLALAEELGLGVAARGKIKIANVKLGG